MTGRVIYFMMIALTFALASCRAEGKAVPQSELNRAHAALQSSLDAWKKGSQPTTSKGPVAEVVDPDWKSGLRLVDYMIYNAEGRQGEDIHCGIVLALLDRQGKKLTRDVVYSIHGGDRLFITRAPAK
jgi:hypothetical protein